MLRSLAVAAAAALLLLPLAPLRASAQGTAVDSWSTCGGSQFCPCGTLNCDGQWPGVGCKEWDVCVRQNPTWWRCQPRNRACWKDVPTWSSCGGKNHCPSGTSDCDAPWAGHCCKHGDVCVRKDAAWWRCEPMSSYTDGNVCWDFAGTWEPCGTKKCCANPGDTCVHKSADWSRCEPGKHSPAQPPRGSPPPALAIRDGRIVKADNGSPAPPINGINWFGYNVARQMVDGLGHGGADAATDFGTIVYQLRLLGYNAVRLPFRYRDLDVPSPKSYRVGCWTMGTEDLRRRLMEPGTWTNKALPGNRAALKHGSSGTCNDYLPSSSTYDRMMFTLQALIAQGIYVILDYQPMETEPQALNVKEFVCKWRFLIGRVKALPNFNDDIKGRVLVDVMNEPDSMHIAWEGSGGKPGARELYLSTLDALHALVPDGLLYVLEGTGQNNFGLNWGNGFITDYNIIKRYGISDPNYFFQQLLTKPYWNKVIMSPHVYPPTITKATFLGTALWEQCAAAFGYLQTRGYCQTGRGCTTFPVLIGETGSFMKDSKDVQWLKDFAEFVQARGGARSYNWVPAAGWLWWAYNENSGDTGGIVWDGWSKLEWTKLKYMMYSLGLTPWYKDGASY